MKLDMIPYVMMRMVLGTEEAPTLSLHMHEGKYVAAICPLGSRVAYLDYNGNESLAASDDTPMSAFAKLDRKLRRLGEEGAL